MENPSLSKFQVYTYSILGPISFICGVLLTVSYSKTKRFVHPPGFLMLWINLSITITSFYLGYLGLIEVFDM
jgi:hypothetical protein